MGILTTQESARSFSSYVTAFGLALLITSIIYLKRVDDINETLDCSSIEDYSTCLQISSWRAAAIVGIVIGVIDTLILPFLYCCVCCTICGCALCVVIGCPNILSEDKKTADINGDAEHTETTTINVESDDQPESTNKYDVKNVPSKLHNWMNALGWILWVVGPFLATLFITYSLYNYDAIRTRNDETYNRALALFIVALFNLMVYFQKFMNSICDYVHKKATEKK